MQRKSFPFVIGCLLLLLAACAPGTGTIAGHGRVPDLQAPDLEIGEARIVSFNPPGTGDSFRLLVPVVVSNPNSFALHLQSLAVGYSFGGDHETYGQDWNETVSLLPYGSRELLLQIDGNLAEHPELLEPVARAFSGQARLGFGLTMDAAFTTPHHPWQNEGHFELSGRAPAGGAVEMPLLELLADESSVYSLQVGEPVISVRLAVVNPGAVGYLVHAKDLVLSVAGQPLATFDLTPTPVEAFGHTVLDLQFTPDPQLLGRPGLAALSDALAGATTELELSGQVALDVLGMGTFQMPASLQLDAVIHAD